MKEETAITKKAISVIRKLPTILKQRLRKYNTTLEKLINSNETFYLEESDIYELIKKTNTSHDFIISVLTEYGIAKELKAKRAIYYKIDYYLLVRLLDREDINEKK